MKKMKVFSKTLNVIVIVLNFIVKVLLLPVHLVQAISDITREIKS